MIATVDLDFLRATIGRAYRDPRPTVSPWRWADDHVYLDEKASPRPGPYRSSETPWVRRFCDIFIDPAFTECLVMKSSRTGFTEGALNLVRYMPEHAPGTVLFCLDSKEEARNVSNDRLASSLRHAAAGHFSDDPDDDGTLTKRLRNMTVLLAGSYSAGVFRNKWVRLGVLDEVEVNPEVAGEGSTLDMMRSRLRGVPGARLYAISKPKRHGSIFHRQVAQGTCEIFLAPCPHCGTWQEFTFDGTSATEHIHLDKVTAPLIAKPAPLGRVDYEHCRDLTGAFDETALLTTTYYRCVSGCKIREEDKPAILAEINRTGARWLRTNPRPIAGRCSQHVSDLLAYEPRLPENERLTWGRLAQMWTSCTDQLARDHFRNNHLGLPARDEARAVSGQAVLDCRTAYERGTAPFVPDWCILNWDTQDDLLHWAVSALRLVPGRDLPELAVVDWGQTLVPDDLLQIRHYEFTAPDGTKFHPAAGLGDAGGHRTAEIYETCLRSRDGGPPLYPAFGRGGIQAITALRETVFKHGQREVTGYLFSDDQYKRRLYFDLIAAIDQIRRTAAERSLGLDTPQARLHLPADLLDTHAGQQFKDGFTKEKTIERNTRGGLVVEWDPNVKGNEAGDIVKQALVAWDMRRPSLQRERAAEEAQRQADKAKDPTPTPRPAAPH